MIGAPSSCEKCRISLMPSCGCPAKFREIASCPSWRKFTANAPARWMIGCIRARRSTQTMISSGSSESEVKAFAVMPWMSSSTRVVTTVTPVAKSPARRRYSRGSIGCGWSLLSLPGGPLHGGGRDGRFVLVEKIADALLGRFFAVAEVQCPHHPDGITKEVALVHLFPPAEAGAGDVPREPVEPHTLLLW